MATRRHDPDRRQRIVDAALAVIADKGVAGCTHRSVAEVAGVPLGSMTYHFDSREDLILQAFDLLATKMLERWQWRLGDVDDAHQALEVLVDWVCGEGAVSGESLLPVVELYVYAARNPDARQLMGQWMVAVQAALSRWFDPVTARALDAVVEGVILHNAYSDGDIDRLEVRALLQRITGLPA